MNAPCVTQVSYCVKVFLLPVDLGALLNEPEIVKPLIVRSSVRRVIITGINTNSACADN